MKSLLTKLRLKDNGRRMRDTLNTCRRHLNRRGRYISSIYTTDSKSNEKLHEAMSLTTFASPTVAQVHPHVLFAIDDIVVHITCWNHFEHVALCC